MFKNRNLHFVRRSCRKGVALIMVVMVLVALSAIVYRLGLGVSQWKSRQQYMIDYQKARYGCESGIKYAITTVDELDANYVERPNEPDFSDVFAMSETQYREMLTEWAEEMEKEFDANEADKDDMFSLFASLSGLGGGGDSNDGNDSNGLEFGLFGGDEVDDINQTVNEMVVRGPYGPVWPCVVEPIEIDFDDSQITIEVADENAKLPLTWSISADKDVEDEAAAAVVTFLEWMQMWPDDIELLEGQFEQISDVKVFSVKLKPIITKVKTKTKAKSDNARSKRKSSRRRTRRSTRKSRVRSTTKKVARPDIGHNRDFAKLLYSPMLDSESLAVVNDDQIEGESAIKYISRWGAQRVNINSAPRHVLEAAFTFGGDAVEIADEIIEMRKIEAFKDIDDLKKRLYSYSDSVDKSENYICTKSSFYSINVTAVSGLAKISASVGLKKNDEGKVEVIGFVME